MSTRCQIKLKESSDSIHIYKHSDGYPEDVIPTLKPFVERFFKNRGNDSEYLLAQIIRAFAIRDYKERLDNDKTGKKQCSKLPKDDNFLYGQDYLGWGLGCIEHGDIAYLYEIDDKGMIYINDEKLTDEHYQKIIKEYKLRTKL